MEKIYKVKTPVEHNGTRYEPEDEIELEDEHAEPLLAVNAISDPSDKPAKPVRTPRKVERKAK